MHGNARKTSYSKDVVKRVDQLLTLSTPGKFSADDTEIFCFLFFQKTGFDSIGDNLHEMS